MKRERKVEAAEPIIAKSFPCTECADGIAELHSHLFCSKPSDNTAMKVYQCDRCRRVYTPGLLVVAADSAVSWRGESVEDRRKRRPVTVEEVADVVNQPLGPPRSKYCDKCGDEIFPAAEWYYTDEDVRDCSIICRKCTLAEAMPDTDPISITICKGGGESEQVTFSDLNPCTATAAEINAGLRKAGYDASMVSAMTPLHMLENAERRMASAEERCKAAQNREQAWVDWFEELRMKYDGVNEQAATAGKWTRSAWRVLEEIHPWPSLEDERAEAIEDE